MNYDEVLNIWGRNLLRTRGISVIDSEAISVNLVTENHGYCDTCAYSTVAVEISTRSGVSYSFDDYEFVSILNELVAISVANADKIS